ncbi:SDR family NAD(P)-dependent oxidoreductase [Nesterenkonia pannonica]|uniref:SDR family NAD(P)-dependent oxidoreductase n=1 Tax=Nesterenkonia pannonica TaxID=1548602 RepID=UPI002164E8D2|nr:SDR family NAD(P)-dependent oxidoreductase [Nesterenkonia pannonica]
MTTIAIIGAGRGLGAEIARRFGKEGFDLALISRSQERLDTLATDLQTEGFSAKGYAANVRDPESLANALDEAVQEQGPIEVLTYSPLPQKEFLRPLLETTAHDLQGAVEFSIYGPVTAVHQVLQGMRFLGRGTVLFVNGGSGARPSAHVAGTSIAFAGESAYAQMLHDELAEENIHVGQLIIPGAIALGDSHTDPKILAETLWSMHQDRNAFRVFARDFEG